MNTPYITEAQATFVRNFTEDKLFCAYTGGRGTGKTTALAVAAAEILKNHKEAVLYVGLSHQQLHDFKEAVATILNLTMEEKQIGDLVVTRLILIRGEAPWQINCGSKIAILVDDAECVAQNVKVGASAFEHPLSDIGARFCYAASSSNSPEVKVLFGKEALETFYSFCPASIELARYLGIPL